MQLITVFTKNWNVSWLYYPYIITNILLHIWAFWLQEWERVLEDCHKRSCWKNSIGVGITRLCGSDVYVCSKSCRLCLTVVYWLLECNKVPSRNREPRVRYNTFQVLYCVTWHHIVLCYVIALCHDMPCHVASRRLPCVLLCVAAVSSRRRFVSAAILLLCFTQVARVDYSYAWMQKRTLFELLFTMVCV
jgi:hypothetical protein